MKLLIDQPGRNGDILICLPIAKWYSKEYEVDWLCPQEYHLNFRGVGYCRPVVEICEDYDKVIDLSFGVRQGTKLHDWWVSTQHQWQSFIIPKYKLAGVPLIERWNLVWNRNIIKENRLYDKIVDKYGSDYAVVHESTHDVKTCIQVNRKVLFSPIEDFSIFDWYKVLVNAREIYCIDSLLCNFVDVIPELLEMPKFCYKTSRPTDIWGSILINNWIRK